MIAGFSQIELAWNVLDLRLRFLLSPGQAWQLGWQIYDPHTGAFLQEGDWLNTPGGEVEFAIPLPAEPGRYHVYVSPRDDKQGWHFQQHYPFVLVEAQVQDGQIVSANAEVTTLARLQRRDWPRKARLALIQPVQTIWRNRRLIASLVRREITARYRGSVGDALWTILHPLLLMLTYFFVFGIVLQARFGADPSRSGFVLYFLAAMLPWLPFAEAVGRAPSSILENRNFVKKLVFPIETISVNHVLAGLITEAFALLVFLTLLAFTRGAPPPTALLLPLLLIPQFLLTLGLCWLLSALGVFLRDLGQIIGFGLTLVFFLTPICYPDASLPPWARGVLSRSPIYLLVDAYRAILLENRWPDAASLLALTIVSAAIFFCGYAFFWRFRRTFADVI
ncbi:MAG: ABC transporter permease [Bryobacterales bacterium]|nr:ABC transporter permease [Bryobacterales bacterium]